jgi:hypothetical protein
MKDLNPNDAVKLTADKIRTAKQVECDCGGALFSEKIMFKKISAIISPTGKEELYPMQVIVCDSCGKIPSQFNPHNLISEEYLAKNKNKLV